MLSRIIKWRNHEVELEDVGPPDIYKPVVCIHGLLDPTFSLDVVADIIRKYHPGTNVKVITLYNGFSSFASLWEQIDKFKDEIEKISAEYPQGIHLIGFSQGAMIARGIVETSDKHNVDTFIAVSGPLMGQYGYSKIDKVPGYNWLMKSISKWFSNPSWQRLSVAEFWRDPHDKDLYNSTNSFLPILNNELPHNRSEEFKKNFTRIKRLVLIGSESDDTITPWQSSIFGFYDEYGNIIDMKDQEVYKNDSFGLKTLDERNAITTHIVPNFLHHYFVLDIPFIKNYILPCLK